MYYIGIDLGTSSLKAIDMNNFKIYQGKFERYKALYNKLAR